METTADGGALRPTCVACGGTADVGASSRHDLAACSPCRAEHAGAVELRLPDDADPHVLGLQLLVLGRHRDYLVEGRGVFEALRVWADALETAAGAVRRLRDIAERGSTDAEAVAHALLTGSGGQPRLDEARAGSPASVFRLFDLPAPLARRLAAECPEIASGPALPEHELLRLAGAPDRRR